MIIQYKNKIIGELENGVFTKKVNTEKHLMRIYDAWGIDREIFDKYLKDTTIVITDETGKAYRTTSSRYESDGVTRDFGHGEQIFLARKNFEQEGQNMKLDI